MASIAGPSNGLPSGQKRKILLSEGTSRPVGVVRLKFRQEGPTRKFVETGARDFAEDLRSPRPKIGRDAKRQYLAVENVTPFRAHQNRP